MITLLALEIIKAGLRAYNNVTTHNSEKEEICSQIMSENLKNNELKQIEIKDSFQKLIKEISTPTEDCVEKIEGIFKSLKYIYCWTVNTPEDKSLDKEEICANTIIKDFKEFVLQFHDDKKETIKTMEELKPLLISSFRGNSDLELKKAYFKDLKSGVNYADLFQNKIWDCYTDIILDGNNKKEVEWNGTKCKKKDTLQIRNYSNLLGMAGRTYEQLIQLYKNEGIFEEQGSVSNELVYDIAETILIYTQFYFCKGLTTHRLAKDIMESIIDFLHNGLMKKNEISDKVYMEELFCRYIGNREIKTYPYFLKMCTNIYGSLITYSQKNDAIQYDMIAHIRNYDFPFLRGIPDSDIWNDIITAYKEKEYKLPDNNIIRK